MHFLNLFGCVISGSATFGKKVKGHDQNVQNRCGQKGEGRRRPRRHPSKFCLLWL